VSKTERIFRMAQLLRDKGALSKEKILDAFEISEPTFKRDLEFLRSRYGADVQYDNQDKLYRLVAVGNVPIAGLPTGKKAEIPGLWFNETELHALLTVYELLKGLGGQSLVGDTLAPFKERIEHLLARIGSNKREQSLKEVSRRIRILPMAARRVLSTQLSLVAHAVIGRKRLQISYHNRVRDDTTDREISPQRLVHYRDNWYLDAYCHLRERLSTFSVDAITKAKALKAPAIEIEEADLEKALSSSYGIFSGEPVGDCHLRFSPERSRWVCNEVWHPEQVGQWKGRHWELTFPYSDTRELLMDVLKHGDQVEIVSPDELRESLLQTCRSILTGDWGHFST
jgi:predicted DNA-binding transcriptional regulator YafY